MITQLLLAFSLITGAPVQEPGCDRLDHGQPAQFLTFERIGEAEPYLKFESKHRVWFRFRNNTTCAVFVELGTVPRRVHSTEWVDGEQLRLNYYVADSNNRIKFHVSDSHEQAVAEIKPGLSVVFDVPQSYFMSKDRIVVPIAYVWEGLEAMSTEPGSRFMVASRDSLPDRIKRQLKR